MIIVGILIVLVSATIFWGYTALRNQLVILENENIAIQNHVIGLEETLTNLDATLISLNSTYLTLQDYFDQYKENYLYTKDDYETALFRFYYIDMETQKFTGTEQRFGVSVLDDQLKTLSWSQPYDAGTFDCSDMSGHLEWFLEMNGWHTVIVIGESPFSDGRHAWLLVETSEGKYMPVESTTIRIVWWEDQYFDGYLKHDHSFETIQEAITFRSEQEYDWWN